jgi:cytochrome P450
MGNITHTVFVEPFTWKHGKGWPRTSQEIRERCSHCSDELSYTSSQAWKDIYAHHQGRDEFHKDPMQLPRNPNRYPSLIGAERELHGRYRRFLSYPFSNKGLQEQEPRIQSYVDPLIQRLHACNHEDYLDMVKWYNWITFDIIGDLAFGEPFNCLRDIETHPWIHAIYGNVQATPFINAFRRYGLFFLVNYLLPKDMMAKRKANFKYSSEKVAHRRSLGKDRGDFWDRILSDSKEGKHQGMDHGEMTSNAATLVVAGSETTATLLSGATYELLKHPKMMEKLVKEVRTTFKNDSDINLATIGDLHYMEAVMEETLRVYPPVPMQPSRVASRGDMVCGKWVPAGVSLKSSSFFLGRTSESLFDQC